MRRNLNDTKHEVAESKDGYNYCSCGAKLATMGGAITLQVDTEPYKSGEQIEKEHWDADGYINALYCEKGDVFVSMWQDKV